MPSFSRRGSERPADTPARRLPATQASSTKRKASEAVTFTDEEDDDQPASSVSPLKKRKIRQSSAETPEPTASKSKLSTSFTSVRKTTIATPHTQRHNVNNSSHGLKHSGDSIIRSRFVDHKDTGAAKEKTLATEKKSEGRRYISLRFDGAEPVTPTPSRVVDHKDTGVAKEKTLATEKKSGGRRHEYDRIDGAEPFIPTPNRQPPMYDTSASQTPRPDLWRQVPGDPASSPERMTHPSSNSMQLATTEGPSAPVPSAVGSRTISYKGVVSSVELTSPHEGEGPRDAVHFVRDRIAGWTFSDREDFDDSKIYRLAEHYSGQINAFDAVKPVDTLVTRQNSVSGQMGDTSVQQSRMAGDHAHSSYEHRYNVWRTNCDNALMAIEALLAALPKDVRVEVKKAAGDWTPQRLFNVVDELFGQRSKD